MVKVKTFVALLGLVAIVATAAACGSSGSSGSSGGPNNSKALNGAGSTLVAPLVSQWAPATVDV